MDYRHSEEYGRAVAQQLRAEIAAADLPVIDVARRIDMPRVSLDRYLKGQRNLTVAILYRICAGIPIDPRVLIERATLRFHEDMSEAPATIGAPIVTLADYRKEPPLHEEASAAGDVADAEDPDHR